MSFLRNRYFFLSAALFTVVLLTIGCGSNSLPSADKRAAGGADAKPASLKVSTNEGGSYNVDLTVEPGEIKENQPVKLSFTVKDPAGKPNPALDIVHEKPMHLLIVSDDLALFDHIHPEPASDGRYAVETKFPAAGKYKIFLDYTPTGTSQQIARLEVDVAGDARSRNKLVVDKEDTKSFGDLRVTMNFDKQPKAGELTKINCTLADAATGKPVTDLEPYLGAMAHFVIISEDGKEFLHAHPADHNHEHGNGGAHSHSTLQKGGPVVSANTTFPKPGLYKAWAQFQRGGKVITTDFVINIAEGTQISAASPTLESGVQKIKVTVSEQGYEPVKLKLKRGVPAQITFLRTDENNCGDKVVFKQLGIQKELAVGKPVVVEFTPDKEGEFSFTCSMGMYRGTLQVTN